MIGHSLLGEALLKAEEKTEAEKHLQKAVNIMDDWGRKFEVFGTAKAYYLLADILTEREEQKQAYQYLTRGLRIAGYWQLKDFMIRLRDICKSTDRLDDFADLCRNELELRESDDELAILNEFLSEA